MLELKCTKCASEYLHSGRVTVVNRQKRDENDLDGEGMPGTRVVVEADGSLRAAPEAAGDHARQWIQIEFTCECQAKSTLSLEQNKGQTDVSLTAQGEGSAR